ncbi:MAG: nitronate monooxygenase [Nevskia sp.]|nr:nitronate monooxygenase [Nevskia sp.]
MQPESHADPSPIAERLRRGLALPVIAAPMFLVSGAELVVESCKAGVIGTFPTQNARTLDELRHWLERIRHSLAAARAAGSRPGGWGVSMIVHPTYERFAAELELMTEYRPEIVITALGSPRRVLDAVHGYGGAVFADVMSLQHARKAVDAGADGLVLVCSGAGGHTGVYSPFAFVPEVRRFFDGPLVVGGAIGNGRGVRAAEVLGADFAYVGTRFIACAESLAGAEYRAMLLRAGLDGVVATRAVTGVLCNWLRESLAAAGFDEARIASQSKIDFSDVHGGHKPWKNIYGAGQGAGLVERVETVAQTVAQLAAEYREALAPVRTGIPSSPRAAAA